MNLIKLAERCEAATGPDIVLTQDIADFAESAGLICIGMLIPDYTASVDAALTLVPEGYALAEITGGDRYKVRLCIPANPYFGWTAPYRGAETLALAICAASLRARASLENGQ